MSEGFLYIATGRRFLEEASTSARRLREVMPSAKIALASDLEPEGGIFNELRKLEKPTFSFADKVAPLIESPFEKTVFLDTDTWVCEPVGELFDLLDRWDLAMAHAPMRQTASSCVPAVLPEFNSGVIAYRLNDTVRQIFADWRRLYDKRRAETGLKDDQPALRDALWASKVNLLVLPPEYNFRFVMPAFCGRGTVKILHGRTDDYRRVMKDVNGSGSVRVLLPGMADASPRHFRILGRWGRLLRPWFWMDSVAARFFSRVFSPHRGR